MLEKCNFVLDKSSKKSLNFISEKVWEPSWHQGTGWPFVTGIHQWPMASSLAGITHDDVIKWKNLAICAGNLPVPGEFPAQRPMTRSFDVFFHLRLNKRLSKQSQGWWFEMLPCPLWCDSNVFMPNVWHYLKTTDMLVIWISRNSMVIDLILWFFF